MHALKKSQTIWLNVTTSARWNRPAVGIVRVEQALGESLEELYGSEHFKRCIWNGTKFVEWRASQIDNTRILGVGIKFDGPFPISKSFDLLRKFVGRSRVRQLTFDSHQHEATSPPIGPQFGDVIISCGLDWEYGYVDKFHEIKKKSGIFIIGFCHDVIPVLFPQYCVADLSEIFKNYFKNLAWGSSHILCNSQQTESDFGDLCHLLGAPNISTSVVALGDNLPVGTQAISEEIAAIGQKPFLIFVSTIERRKNHEILYRAYHLLCRRGLKSKLPKLVFVGMPGWGVGDFLKDIELDPLTKGLIIQLNHVNDAELAYLYEKALFCLYPSLYEGWGLPVGEALATGKAVVASDQGSLPEVGGDLVRYVDPWNATAWAEALFELIDKPHKIREMEERVRENYNIRRWSDTSATISQIINEMDPVSAFPMRFEPGYDMSTRSGLHCGPSILSTQQDGVLMFGPHCALPPGDYSFALEMRVTGSWTGTLELRVASALGSIVHTRETIRIMPGENGDSFRWVINFLLDDYIDDFEIVCVQNGAVDVAIEGGELTRTEDMVVTPQERLSATGQSFSA